MQIKKVYIENFKGIRRKTIIDLTRGQLTILSGPNGFGKTTIFDVIELCLRGRMVRVDKYSSITRHSADYQKAFYQNDSAADVILKIHLSDNHSDHIIIKRLDKDSSGRVDGSRKFRTDNWQLFETYYSDNPTNFEDSPNFHSLRIIDQRAIDLLFFPEQSNSLTNLYPLFHYLQQEENIHFLKLNEEEKKDNLNFLFQTQKATEEFNRTQTLARGLLKTNEAIQRRLSEIGQPLEQSNVPSYRKLITWSTPAWDESEPFRNISGNQLATTFERYRSEIQNLIDFSSSFDPQEYNKQKTKDKLREYEKSDWLLSTILVRRLLSEPDFTLFRNQREINLQYKKYRTDFSHFIFNEDLMATLAYSKEEIGTMAASFDRRQILRIQSTAIVDIIKDLNHDRDQIFNKFLEFLPGDHSHLETNCPLCDAKWRTLEEFKASYDSKTVQWRSLLNGQEVVISEYELELTNSYIRPLQLKIDEYLASPEHFIDENFFAAVEQRRGNIASADAALAFFRLSNIEISTLFLASTAALSDINDKVQLLRKYLQDRSAEIIIDQSHIQMSGTYTDFYQEKPEQIIKQDALIDYSTVMLPPSATYVANNSMR
jgi:exonuclease SbcC